MVIPETISQILNLGFLQLAQAGTAAVFTAEYSTVELRAQTAGFIVVTRIETSAASNLAVRDATVIDGNQAAASVTLSNRFGLNPAATPKSAIYQGTAQSAIANRMNVATVSGVLNLENTPLILPAGKILVVQRGAVTSAVAASFTWLEPIK